jgi:peptide/nickel transport system permease protein
MWSYIIRRLIYYIPVYLGVILMVMAILRIQDPVAIHLGKNATPEQIEVTRIEFGLDKPFTTQYVTFLKKLVTFDFTEQSWDFPGVTVGSMIRRSIVPSLSITVPALILTTILSICVGMISAYFRGRTIDKTLVFFAVLGMCISVLVYIILGQYFGAYLIYKETGHELFAIQGYEPGLQYWAHYCLLPVMISVIVAMGYDTRFYRAVMVEETGRDYIKTARAKGVTKRKVMFVHMLKNAMIPIVTQVMITLPFLITGSIVLEMYFGIPGMGRALIMAVNAKDFPVIQAFTAVFAALFIITIILTDVLYALVDPRIRLS